MSKGKLAKFADMERYDNVFQCPYSVVGPSRCTDKRHRKIQ